MPVFPNSPGDSPGPLPSLSMGAPAWVRLDTYDQSWLDPGRPKWVILLWWLVQAVCFPLTPHSLHGPRCWLLRRFGATLGQGVVIRPTARFTYPWNVTIGDHSWIGDDVVLYSLAQHDPRPALCGFAKVLPLHGQPRYLQDPRVWLSRRAYGG
jgi:hypothetical protein